MPLTKPGPAYICLPCLIRRTNPRSIGTTIPQSQRPLTPRASLHQSHDRRQEIVTSSTEPLLTLNSQQVSLIGSYDKVRKELETIKKELQKQPDYQHGISFSTLAEKARPQLSSAIVGLVNEVEKIYPESKAKHVLAELKVLHEHRRLTKAEIKDEKTIELLKNLKILKEEKIRLQKASPPKVKAEKVSLTSRRSRIFRTRGTVLRVTKVPSKRSEKQEQHAIKDARREAVRGRQAAAASTRARTVRSPRKVAAVSSLRKDQPPDDAQLLDASFIKYKSIDTEQPPQVPHLSFDLSRVLFNPGVYHLQDPRSRVYNFDPYLERIMPVSEFNFDALNPYITSSEDTFLRDVSLEHNKRYIGSSSSMGSAMAHFHFLLSAWRPIDSTILSRKFDGKLDTFTIITRAPGSIFLRWRDGVYAVDADKEYDEPNILMMQGKSMEKLLTLEKDDFEKYRKSKAGGDAPMLDAEPEAYHYSSVGKFLLRSQLDAYDPRLPGTGMFDLKTRAVAGIRMNMGEPEHGSNYEIRNRFGLWESYDREYYDMIRSAFLKYSLQVRMGRMDGIFVAYHNIARIFGFQYISVEELDMALHGQPEPILGDREFKLSLSLLDMMFDVATSKFPKQSLRLTFDTQDASDANPAPPMRFFIEPLTEDQITEIQKSGKQKVDDYERNIMNGDKPKTEPQTDIGRTIEEVLSQQSRSPSTLESSAPDTEFLTKLFNESPEEAEAAISPTDEGSKDKEVLGFTLTIWNEVNGRPVLRPTNMQSDDKWVVKHKLDQMDATTALAKFNVSRNRRSAALAFEKRRAGDWFGNMIRSLNDAGRSYRIEQDQLDATREKTTLYDLGAKAQT